MSEYDNAMDRLARRLFQAALDRDEAGKVLSCLFDGGSATIDAQTGEIVCITAEQIESLGDSSVR